MVHAKKDKNWLRIGCLMALSGFLISNGAQAQVTIGSGNPPAKGALLDLKEEDNLKGGKTTTKGVILPRVYLSDLESLKPLLSDADAADSKQQMVHKGTIVYNVGLYLSEGLYCWDGNKWVKIWGDINDAWLTKGNSGINNFVGTTDYNPLVFKVNDTPIAYMGVENNIAIGVNTGQPEANRMNIGNAIFGTGLTNGSPNAPAGNIGIKTSTPTSTLEVNGSIAGSYREITAPSYNLLPTDYVVCYNGATSATFSLPNITTSIAGRVYYIKNLTANVALTLSAGIGVDTDSTIFRRGGTSPVQSTMTVPPGYHTMIVATTSTSGPVWDVLSLQNSQIATTGWVLVATDIRSIVNQKQELKDTPPSAPYRDIIGSDLTVTVPADLSGENQVLLRWDVWGDVEAENASGSIQFAVKEESDARTVQPEPKVMTTSWSTPNNNYFRWAAPVAYGVKNVPPGTYTFTLQVKRLDEKPKTPPTPAPPNLYIISLPNVWGVQGKAEVYIK